MLPAAFYLIGSMLALSGLLGSLFFILQFRRTYRQTSFIFYTISTTSAFLLCLAAMGLGIYGVIQTTLDDIVTSLAGAPGNTKIDFIVMVVLTGAAALVLIG